MRFDGVVLHRTVLLPDRQEDRLDRIEKLLEKVIKNTDRTWANTFADASESKTICANLPQSGEPFAT